MAGRRKPRTVLDSMREDRVNREQAVSEQEHAIERERAVKDALHSEVLDTPRGHELLSHFRKYTIDKQLPPLSPDGALRELEAQRNFVRNIEAAITRHRERVGKS